MPPDALHVLDETCLAAGGGLAARVPNAAPSHAYRRRRRPFINARALYFSCYLQVGPAGLGYGLIGVSGRYPGR
jgi:hypothetical protein